jgi:hypothetical protein
MCNSPKLQLLKRHGCNSLEVVLRGRVYTKILIQKQSRCTHHARETIVESQVYGCPRPSA